MTLAEASPLGTLTVTTLVAVTVTLFAAVPTLRVFAFLAVVPMTTFTIFFSAAGVTGVSGWG